MGNTNKTYSKVLLLELNGAGEGFDLKAFAEKVLAALGESEAAIIVVTDKLASVTAENAELHNTVGKLNLELSKATDDLEGAIEQVTDLGNQLSVQQANRGDNAIIVTIHKKQYKLIGNRFSFRGKPEMNAETLSKDKKQLEAMLASESGSLVAVEN